MSRKTAAAALVAAVAAAFANALAASFQFDDWNVIVDEPRVRSLAAWWASMPGIRPLLKLSYAVNHLLGAGAVGFHAVNVAIHAANALLVFALFRRLACREGLEEGRAVTTALATALLFALHPVQTEAVTYVSGRSAALSATFGLAALLAWVRGRERGDRWTAQGLAAVLVLGGVAVKETAVVAPAAMLLWWATDRSSRISWRGAATAAAGPVAAAAGSLLALALLPSFRRLLATSLAIRAPWDNLRAQVTGILFLCGQILNPGRLVADPRLAAPAGWTTATVVAAVLLTGAIALGCALARRRPAVSFGILWFFLWLAPTNSVVPRLDLANDRQVYLALAGPAWLLAWGLARPRVSPRAASAAAVALAAALAIGTVRRNAVYASEVAFWSDVVAKAPENGRAYNNLGYAFAIEGRDAEAEAAFRRALALDPEDTRAGVNLRLLREGALVPRRLPHP